MSQNNTKLVLILILYLIRTSFLMVRILLSADLSQYTGTAVSPKNKVIKDKDALFNVADLKRTTLAL